MTHSVYAIFGADGEIKRKLICMPDNVMIFPLRGEIGVLQTEEEFEPGTHKIVAGEIVAVE